MKIHMKNVIILIIAVLFVLLVITAIILYQYARSKYGVRLEADFTKIVARDDYDVRITEQSEEVTYLTKDNGGDFKILAFTDMHFDGLVKAPMDKTMDEFLNAMNKEQPDLVIFTGDTVTAIFNKERAELLAEIMEAYGVYWCAVLGNHEGEHPLSYSREKLIKLWANDKKYPHCLVESGPKDISGYGNYIVNLLDSDNLITQSLIFMDSGDFVTEEDVNTVKYGPEAYDYIKADQIAWYQEQIKALPEGTKSSLFIHIPLSEYATGWDEIYDEASGTITDTPDCMYVDGYQREEVCCSEYNSGLFDVIEALGSTKSVYCGHDHVNDYSIIYKGVKLNYLQASGYSIYGWNDATGSKTEVLEEQSMQGYTILEMNSSGETQITRIRYKKKEDSSLEEAKADINHLFSDIQDINYIRTMRIDIQYTLETKEQINELMELLQDIKYTRLNLDTPEVVSPEDSEPTGSSSNGISLVFYYKDGSRRILELSYTEEGDLAEYTEVSYKPFVEETTNYTTGETVWDRVLQLMLQGDAEDLNKKS